MKCSVGISNFLEELSSLSHSIVFLYFFALITEEGFLISLCYSLELCIQMGISFLFSFAFSFSSFSAISKASSDNHFAFFHLFFLGMTQTCLWVSRSLQWRRGSAAACCRFVGTECGSACMEPFEGCCHDLHYLDHSLVLGQTTGREHSSAHQQKIGLKIYWAWPHPPKQFQVSHKVSLSHQQASIGILFIPQRADRMKTIITEN